MRTSSACLALLLAVQLTGCPASDDTALDACSLQVTIQYEGYGTTASSVLTYDEDDNLLLQEGFDGDGVLERLESWTYDDEGNLIVHELDYGADDDIDGRYTATWDGDSRLLTETWEDDIASGKMGTANYTWGSAGRLLTQEVHTGFEEDRTDFLESYAYDSAGRIIEVQYDSGADGSPEQVARYVYDGDDLVQLDEEHHSGVNRTTWTYDDRGNALTETRDYGTDGVADQLLAWTWDAADNMLTATTDHDADGEHDQITTRTYDADGNLLTQHYDDDMDSDFEEELDTWSYDGRGNTLSWVHDDNTGQDGIDSRYTWTHDAQDRVLSEEIDWDPMGTADERSEYDYDCW